MVALVIAKLCEKHTHLDSVSQQGSSLVQVLFRLELSGDCGSSPQSHTLCSEWNWWRFSSQQLLPTPVKVRALTHHASRPRVDIGGIPQHQHSSGVPQDAAQAQNAFGWRASRDKKMMVLGDNQNLKENH